MCSNHERLQAVASIVITTKRAVMCRAVSTSGLCFAKGVQSVFAGAVHINTAHVVLTGVTVVRSFTVAQWMGAVSQCVKTSCSVVFPLQVLTTSVTPMRTTSSTRYENHTWSTFALQNALAH